MQWLSFLPFMTKETFVTFNDFVENTKPKKIDTRPKDEIMRELLKKG